MRGKSHILHQKFDLMTVKMYFICITLGDQSQAFSPPNFALKFLSNKTHFPDEEA